uniref:(northern house mosquito) hypothetical protein n=1 Tax=Culex pipiens TaxID=7175 RepID=A0A8D7ZZI6_CULPI
MLHSVLTEVGTRSEESDQEHLPGIPKKSLQLPSRKRSLRDGAASVECTWTASLQNLCHSRRRMIEIESSSASSPGTSQAHYFPAGKSRLPFPNPPKAVSSKPVLMKAENMTTLFSTSLTRSKMKAAMLLCNETAIRIRLCLGYSVVTGRIDTAWIWKLANPKQKR